MSIQTWGIIGTGPMGRGIAELVASKGFGVILVGHSTVDLDGARQQLSLALQREIERWAITESEKRVILSRIHYSADISALVRADFVTVAMVAEIKKVEEVFRQLDQLCRPEVILTSNTSTLSITQMAAATVRPDRVIGCHFLSPMTRTKVVEVVRGLKTSDETVAEVKQLMERLDRQGIEVHESTGYVTTRLVVPLINEACSLLMEGVATAEDIDTAMRLGFEMARGPLEIADRMGLDTLLVMCERLWREYGDLRYRPSPIVRKLVRAGQRGVETRAGFFRYDEDGDRIKDGGSSL